MNDIPEGATHKDGASVYFKWSEEEFEWLYYSCVHGWNRGAPVGKLTPIKQDKEMSGWLNDKNTHINGDKKMNYTLEQFKKDVIKWSTDRMIIQNGSIDGQQQKGREECAETIMEINNTRINGRTTKNLLELKKEVGDIAVIMINVDYMQGSYSDYSFVENTGATGNNYKIAVECISKIHTLIKLDIEQYTEIWDYLNSACWALGVDLSECAYLAFKKIEHRKGYFCKESMSFIKESE